MKKMSVICVIGLLVLVAILAIFARSNISRSAADRLNVAKKSDNTSSERRPTEASAVVQSPEQKTLSGQDNFPEPNGVADIAGVNLPILFEDGSVSEALRHEIEIDLEGLFATRDSYKIHENIGDLDGISKTMIKFYGGHAVPDIVSGELYELRRIGGEEHIVVTKKLSEAYSGAIEFRERHRQEYSALIAARDRINQTRPEDVTEENAWEIMPIASDKELSRKNQMEAVAGNVKAEFGHPSVMSFQMRNPAECGVESNSLPVGNLLSAVIYAKDPDRELYHPILFFWNGSKWIAAIPVPGD